MPNANKPHPRQREFDTARRSRTVRRAIEQIAREYGVTDQEVITAARLHLDAARKQ